MTFFLDSLAIVLGLWQVTCQYQQTSLLPIWPWTFWSLFWFLVLYLSFCTLTCSLSCLRDAGDDLFISPKSVTSFWSLTLDFGEREKKKGGPVFIKILFLKATWFCLPVYAIKLLSVVSENLNKKEKTASLLWPFLGSEDFSNICLKYDSCLAIFSHNK